MTLAAEPGQILARGYARTRDERPRGREALPTALRVSTVAVRLPAGLDLLDLVPDDEPVSWVRRGEGLVGWGVAAQVRTSGATRFADAAKWWSELTARAEVADEVGEPGTGLVSFGTFAFADDPGDSVLVVPAVVVGRRGGRAWLTTVSTGAGLDRAAPPWCRAAPPRAPHDVTFADGSLDGERWMGGRGRRGAPGSRAASWRRWCWPATWSPPPTARVDVRWPLRRLAERLPHVLDLPRRRRLRRHPRDAGAPRAGPGHLAGAGRHHPPHRRRRPRPRARRELAHSSKDLEEHEYAVRSVADALEPHCSSMNVPESPFVLHLPNVMHLATDVAGVAARRRERLRRCSSPRRCTPRPRSAARPPPPRSR